VWKNLEEIREVEIGQGIVRDLTKGRGKSLGSKPRGRP